VMLVAHAAQVGAVEGVATVSERDDVVNGGGAYPAALHRAHGFLSQDTLSESDPARILVDLRVGALRSGPIRVRVGAEREVPGTATPPSEQPRP
jgi:hypothetical protein